jgi:Aldehyde dehydrogenase family
VRIQGHPCGCDVAPVILIKQKGNSPNIPVTGHRLPSPNNSTSPPYREGQPCTPSFLCSSMDPGRPRVARFANPATGEVIGSVAHADEGDPDRALEAAEKAFRAWRKVSADLVRRRADAIARLMTLRHGKPRSATNSVSTIAAPIKNIVLVHGAWVNRSGWKPVFAIFVRDGHRASVAEPPLTSFSDDVAGAKRVIATQDGPTIH